MELVGPISELLRWLGAPICRYIDNHRKLEERVKDLQEQVDLLNTRKRDVELRVKADLRWGKILREEVEKWLQDVQSINHEIEDIDQRVQNISCFSQACLGKRVAQKVEQVKKIIERGRFTEALVIDKPSTSGAPFQLEYVEGETIVIEEIWNYLMGDEIGMIGVCGMGGIGKTTVMKHIYNQLSKEAKPLFDVVIWVTVSKELNITRLQKKIASAVKIVSFPEDEQERVAALMDQLGQRKYVLILDDVWKRFSLLELGIPKPTSSNGSKVVLTSRSIDVCKSMDCKIVKVRPLSNEESMNLFLENVGRGVLKVPSLKTVLEHIVQECAGLPLAIVVIAGSMKGVYDVHEWRNALRELREHVRSVKGTDIEIFERLKFSYDRLGDSKIQNCFLYCSLYPEDFIIPRMELIEYWIDEGFLEIGSRQEMYDRGYSILNMLENNCLLEKHGNRGHVKMHDVMRDTALYIKSCGPSFMVKAGMELEELPSKQEWPNDVEKASFMKNNISEIPPNLSPNCEILSTLILQNNMSLRRIAESFFQHMQRLSILDLSYTSIEQLPNSLSNLEKLKSLVLRGCEFLRFLPSLEKLTALKKLDLCNTDIEEVPTGLEMLADLTYLNLKTESLKGLPVEVISKLSWLQYLVLDIESGTSKISADEAAGLRKLETFEGRFNDLIDFNSYSSSIKGSRLTSYLLVMAPLEAKFMARPELDVRSGASFMVTIILKLDMCKLPHERKFIRSLVNTKGLKSVDFDRKRERLTLAGYLEPTKIAKKIRKNFGEHIIKSVRLKLPDVLSRKEVILSGCHLGREDPVALPSDLWCLRISECHNLRSLSDISLLQQANELKFCSIRDCRGIESVLDFSSLSSSPCITFQNLELLSLENMDNLRMLVEVGDISLSSNALPLLGIFSHLKSIQIKGCSNMKQLFPFELGDDFQNLENLVVADCGKMEEIIASEDDEENHKGKGTHSPPIMFSLPKLGKLILRKLPKLKSICSSNRGMKCDSLEDIEVWKCPNLKRMPLYLPHFQEAKRSLSPPSGKIRIYPKEWWKSVEWDFPSAKKVLEPWLVL